jgi:hypothetical protein
MVLKKIIFFLLALLLIPVVFADFGPKPTVEITLYENNQKLSVNAEAALLSCQSNPKNVTILSVDFDGPSSKTHKMTLYDPNKECYWANAQLAWGGDCRNGVCKFHYNPPREFKFATVINEQFYITNTIERKNFNSYYKVNLEGNSATIKETTPFLHKDRVRDFIPALILTLIIEIIAALIILPFFKKLKTIGWFVIANLISLPIVWFIFPFLKIPLLVILLSEIFAIGFETYFMMKFAKLTRTKALILTIIANLLSWRIGTIIFGLAVAIY